MNNDVEYSSAFVVDNINKLDTIYHSEAAGLSIP